MGPKEWIEFAALLLAGVIMLGGVVKWTVSEFAKRDEKIERVDKQSGERTRVIHDRMDGVYTKFVTKEDHEGDIRRIETALSDGFRGVGQRLDTMLDLLVRRQEGRS
jgi:hypothetical protein